jgi:hypothetical protein
MKIYMQDIIILPFNAQPQNESNFIIILIHMPIQESKCIKKSITSKSFEVMVS